MHPDFVVDSLAKNDQYAKAIVSLAGIRTTPVAAGLPIRIEALWDRPDFHAPLVFSIPTKEADMIWSGDTTKTALFRKTLGLLKETFDSLALPRRVIVFSGEINLESKCLHFKSFTFGTSHVVPTKTAVIFHQTVWDADAIRDVLRRLSDLRRKLRGIGFDGN